MPFEEFIWGLFADDRERIVLNCDLSFFIKFLSNLDYEKAEINFASKLVHQYFDETLFNFKQKKKEDSEEDSEKGILEAFASLNVRNILKRSMEGDFSKQVTLTSAHLLRTFYWKKSEGWLTVKDFSLHLHSGRKVQLSLWKNSSKTNFINISSK